jgi:hypothetical protein
MCTFAARCMISAADTLFEKQSLMNHFRFKRNLVMRGEHAFYHTLCLLVPELSMSERVLDESVLTAQLGKRKSLHDPRPDYFHYFGGSNIGLALHGEYDESPNHEDCDDRLKVIADAAGCGIDSTYIFRVMAWHDTKRSLCVRRVYRENAYFMITEEGIRVAKVTAQIIKERLTWISKGLNPNDSVGRRRKVYINYV